MTDMLYLQDFDVESCTAKVLSISTSTEEPTMGKIDIILDRTCFYPRGGGQDWDQGIFTNGNSTADIEEVRLDESGIAHHYCSHIFDIKDGDKVTCVVDHDRRWINTRLHSAGHMVDMAVESLGYTWIGT